MKKIVLTTIIIASLLMTTSCKDQNSVTTEPDAVSIENPLVVKAQTPKSVLTLGFLLANHIDMSIPSRASEGEFDYIGTDSLNMTEDEAKNFLAPYTQMGKDLRDALVQSYYINSRSRSGDGDGGSTGTGGTGGGNTPGGGDDENKGVILPPEDQEAVDMLLAMTDEELTEVAVILSTMGFDEDIELLNGYAVSIRHTLECAASAFLGIEEEILKELYNFSMSRTGKKIIIQCGKKELFKIFGKVVSKFVPFLDCVSLALDIYDFTNCMINPMVTNVPEEKYNEFLEKYDWMTQYNTMEFQIIPD